METCNKCGAEFETKEGNFPKSKTSRSGYLNFCKQCLHQQQRDWLVRTAESRRPLTFLEIQRENSKWARYKKKITNYERKFRWTEDQSYFLNDIKLCEL